MLNAARRGLSSTVPHKVMLRGLVADNIFGDVGCTFAAVDESSDDPTCCCSVEKVASAAADEDKIAIGSDERLSILSEGGGSFPS